MLNRMNVRQLVTAVTMASAVFSAPLAAQQRGATTPPSLQTSLANDVGTLSDKFAGLARVMAGKYDWRSRAC